MRTAWGNVTTDDVIAAIKLFEKQKPTYPEPKNTFLLYKDKRYPAKHIRGLAYKIANKKEISKEEYSGGQETTTFLRQLGFKVEYKRNSFPSSGKSNREVQTVVDSQNTPKLNGRKLSVVSQKNALQRLLQVHFGHIEIEKKFVWLKTPEPEKLPKEYVTIVKNLLAYRNQDGFLRRSCSLSCDIVLDAKKLIIEYDENQHFSKAREVCLKGYTRSITVGFSKERWISACQKISAKDNFPIDRDERRAYYDSVRDIEAYRNGYRLIRIKHGDVDWEAPNAEQHLRELLSSKNAETVEGITNHKIARFVVTKKQYDKYGDPIYERLYQGIDKFLSKAYKREHFEFIVTPGGFLKFQIRDELFIDYREGATEEKLLPTLKSEAEKTVLAFFKSMPHSTRRKLSETANYITIGIDGYPNDYGNGQEMSIELVCVYDLKKGKIVHWTGKSYPTESQKRTLVKVNDLKSHFTTLRNQRVAIFGCHDLNIYSPRGQASATMGSWKSQTSAKLRRLCSNFKPEVILQHPHTTDTPNIWNLAWHTLQKELPKVQHFASGIMFHDWRNGGPRGDLQKVLAKTKKGDVVDFLF